MRLLSAIFFVAAVSVECFVPCNNPSRSSLDFTAFAASKSSENHETEVVESNLHRFKQFALTATVAASMFMGPSFALADGKHLYLTYYTEIIFFERIRKEDEGSTLRQESPASLFGVPIPKLTNQFAFFL